MGRGSPSPPSMEAISAVSSPHTNAPAPRTIWIEKLKPEPRMFSPSKPCASACAMAAGEALDGQRVLVADVGIALARADGIRADDHPLDDAVRIAFQHGAIHVRAGVAFVAVADDDTCSAPAASRATCHLRPVGKPPPPRPRRPERVTSSITCCGVKLSQRARQARDSRRAQCIRPGWPGRCSRSCAERSCAGGRRKERRRDAGTACQARRACKARSRVRRPAPPPRR